MRELNYNHSKENRQEVPFRKDIDRVMRTKDKCQEMSMALKEDDLVLDRLILETEVDKTKQLIEKMMIIKLW